MQCPRCGGTGIIKDHKAFATAFEDVWSKYPKRIGKKAALRHFLASVLCEKDLDDIYTALNNYKLSKTVADGFIQNGSTWFNNWRDYLDVTAVTGKSKDLLELEAMTNVK